MKNDAGNLAVVPQTHKVLGEWRHESGGMFDLLADLQTTLDIAQLLQMFSEHLQASVPHEGYGFHNPLLNLDLEQGREAHHHCSYTLKLQDETLGEWRMRRDRRFSQADLEITENLLSHLLYPLRNCLRYREAVCYAHTDPLTQVGNRIALLSQIQREIDLARRHGTPFAVVFLDIDHFKAINDTHGHAAGDAVLRSVAHSVKQVVRSTDGVFRYGGEEFVVLFSHVGRRDALSLAERIRQAVAAQAHPVGEDGATLMVTVSLGLALLAPGESPMALMNRADQAMYKAKRLGRNRVAMA